MAQRVVEKQVIFEGKKIRLEVHHLQDDETGRRYAREVVVHPGAVVIIPLLPDGQILLIQNHRYVINRTLIELPAGTLEFNELPMNCAGRELLEETGYLAGKLQPLLNFYSSPGVMSEQLFLFIARNLELDKPRPDEGEEIEPYPMSLESAIAAIRDGQIVDGKTIAALLAYEKFADGVIPMQT